MYAIGVPKGLCGVLKERSINTHGKNGDRMREILGSHPDFKIRNRE
jgi:hypothetical protein